MNNPNHPHDPLAEIHQTRLDRMQEQLDRIKTDKEALDRRIDDLKKSDAEMQRIWPHSAAETRRKAGIQ